MEVKCIDADVSWGLLSQGTVYKVYQDLPYNYIITDNGGCLTKWLKDRFEIVSEFQNFKVRCIDNSTISLPCPLVLGQIYEVDGNTETSYQLVGEPLGWLKTRFETVSDSDFDLLTYQHVLDLIDQHIRDWKYGAIQDNRNIRALDTNSIVKALEMLKTSLSSEQSRRTNKVD